MRTATIHELKNELAELPGPRLAELCLRLAKFKKDNKELLTYLLFEAHDEQGYLTSVKKEVDEQFSVINQSNLYFAKKTIRKVLRLVNKHIRYTGSKQTEVELRIYFCLVLKESGIPFQKSLVLNNLFEGQLKKAREVINSFHEDLQYDYLKELRQFD